MPSAALNIAILGGGLFPNLAYIPALVEPVASGTVHLSAIYSRSYKSAASTAAEAVAKLGVSLESIALYTDDGHQGDGVVGDLEALLANQEVKAVIIALPIPIMPEMVLKALEAGKHVLGEKPVAFNVKVANETIKKYREVYEPKGLIWRVAENYEFEDALIATGEIIKSGKLGALRSFSYNSTGRMEKDSMWYNTAWRTVPTFQGGFLLDGGVHYIAALRTMLDSPLASLTGHASLTLPHCAPFDTIDAVVKLESGVQGTFRISVAGPKGKKVPIEFEAWMEDGYIEIHSEGWERTVKVYDAEGAEISSTFYASSGVAGEFKSFFNFVSNGKDDGKGRPEGPLIDLAFIQAGLLSEGKKVVLQDLIARS